MTRSELLKLVRTRELEGRAYFIRFSDIPQPLRDQFRESMSGSQCPVVESASDPGDCAYLWDWHEFVHFGRYGSRPQGLQPE